jgi:branched-subunit amino acid transport protein
MIVMGAALVTFIPRVLPLMVLTRLQLPDWSLRWLNYVPIAVMAALIGQEIFIQDGAFSPIKNNIELIAALPTFMLAIWTRSLFVTVITGVVASTVLRFLF